MTGPKQRIGGLLGVSIGLAAMLAFELMAGPFFVPEAPTMSPGLTAPIATSGEPPAPSPELSTYSEVVRRPLFAETRRPPAPKAAAPVAATEEKHETFDLIGVVISGTGRMALLRELTTNEVTRAVEGQSVGGWEVSDIKPTQIVLKRGDDSEIIKINDEAAAPPVDDHPAIGDRSSLANLPEQASLPAEGVSAGGEAPPAATPESGQTAPPAAPPSQPESSDEVTTE